MSYLLPPSERKQMRAWLDKEQVNAETWKAYLNEFNNDSAPQEGSFCYVDHETQVLYIRDLKTQKTVCKHNLKTNVPADVGTFPSWGTTFFQIESEEGRFEAGFSALETKQGLLVNKNRCYLYPLSVHADYLSQTYHYYSPYNASSGFDAHDLICSEDGELLFVTHRWAGNVSVFSLETGKLMGLINVRGKGSTRSINIATDTKNNKIYLTDNETPSLHVFNLQKRKLESYHLPLGKLGNIAMGMAPEYLYLEVLQSEPKLVYLDVETLSVVTKFNLKGGSLCVDAKRPVDFLLMTPQRDLLLFMTYLDSPHRFTPVVNVIDTKQNRTVRRYSIKSKDIPLLLLMVQESDASLHSSELLSAYLNKYPLNDVDKSVEQVADVPEIELPDSAESVMVEMCAETVSQRFGTDLSAFPVARQNVRLQAVEAKRDLQKKKNASLIIEDFEEPVTIGVNRKKLFRAMQESPLHQGALYKPQSFCPFCGVALDALQCENCGNSIPQPVKKAKYDAKLIKSRVTALNESQRIYLKLLQGVSFLKSASPQLLNALSAKLVLHPLEKDTQLIKEGDLGASLFFILEGTLLVFKEQTPDTIIATLAEGDIVGEMAVATSERRSASVKTKENSVLLRLDRTAFLQVVRHYPEFAKELKALTYARQSMTQKIQINKKSNYLEDARIYMAINNLRSQKLFPDAPVAFFKELAKYVESVAFVTGRDVCKQEDAASKLFFIERGRLEVRIDDVAYDHLSEGVWFGEMAFFLNASRFASVRTLTMCRLMALDYEDFSRIISNYPELKARFAKLALERFNANQQKQMQNEALTSDLPALNVHLSKQNPLLPFLFVHANFSAVLTCHASFIKPALSTPSPQQLFEAFRVQLSKDYFIVADTGNDRILQGTVENGYEVIWENMMLNQPHSACFDAEECLLIADTGNQRLLRVNTQGEIVQAFTEEIIAPVHVSMTPEGNFLYADKSMHQVVELNKEEEVLWEYGTPLIEGCEDNELSEPHFAGRASNGLTLVADTGNHRLLWIDDASEIVDTWTGTAAFALERPIHCESDAHGGWFVQCENGRMFYFTADGDPVWIAEPDC